MSLQEIIAKGTLVSTGAAQSISIPAGFDMFHLRNRTTHLAGAGITDAYWYANDPAGWATTDTVAGGVITTNVIAANGFVYSDSSLTPLGPAIAVTAVTAATPAVAATGTTPGVGDIVRIYGTTGMLQIAGMDFSVTAVTPGVNMTFGYLPAVAFAAPATAGFYRRVPFEQAFIPRKRFITAITVAPAAVVTLSVTHGYAVGEKVSFIVPAAFGMTQMNGLTGTITAVNPATNTITTDIDSATFTAFVYPATAIAAAGVSFPHIVPAGEAATILTGAIRDTSSRQILLGTAICGTAADVFDYWAIRSET
jgi:hypothetical protein